MSQDHLIDQLGVLAKSLFQKDFFSLYHGSISAKTQKDSFLINKKEAIFDNINKNTLIELNMNVDYRYKQASIDADIHKNIYNSISDAKFIIFCTPPHSLSYSLQHNVVIPKDYFGHKLFNSLEIYNPQNFEQWHERAKNEILQYFLHNKTDIMLIRGYGIFAYNRDPHEIIKKIAVLEKSCSLL